MKRKIFSILLTTVLTVSLLAGCGGTEGDSGEKGGTSDNVENTDDDKSNNDDSSSDTQGNDAENSGDENNQDAQSEGTDLSNLIIGEIQSYTIDDGGWCQAMHQGLVASMKELGIPEENLLKVENVAEDPTSVEAALESLVDNGANIVIGCSTGYGTFLSELAPEYPDVIIAQFGNKLDNLISIQIRGYEGMFLAGYASALLSPTDELGFCASMNDASVRTAINAYALGAKYAKETATVQVVWANSWYDPEKEAQNATTLIDNGITYMGIEASSPAIPQTCEEKGAFCVGYNVDMEANAPGAVITSYMWNWQPIFTQIFNSVADGTVSTNDQYYEGGEASALADFNTALVPDDVIAKVTEARDKINSGEIKIYGGELKDVNGNILVEAGAEMSDEDINFQDFFVENVKGSEGAQQ